MLEIEPTFNQSAFFSSVYQRATEIRARLALPKVVRIRWLRTFWLGTTYRETANAGNMTGAQGL